MIVGTAICYAFGTLWFCLSSGSEVVAALSICVIPFIPGDLIKMILAIMIAPGIRKQLDIVSRS